MKVNISTLNKAEIIPNRFQYTPTNEKLKREKNKQFIKIDDTLTYYPFCHDFGPLDISQVTEQIKLLKKLMNEEKFINYEIYHISSENHDHKANAIWLICAYCIIILKYSAKQAFKPFKHFKDIIPFRDALKTPCSQQCTILDCCKALEQAVKLGWQNQKKFDIEEQRTQELVENGDSNWICPDKMLAFASPSDDVDDGQKDPNDYLEYFKEKNIKLVVRLNNSLYDENKFINEGIQHKDLQFIDGSCPPNQILHEFLEICENQKNAIAVHCKAGLGRAGTLICCQIMKHYKFKAPDVIAWIRLCRPGSICGPQQQYLCEQERYLFKLGKNFRKHGKIVYEPDYWRKSWSKEMLESWNKNTKSSTQNLNQSDNEIEMIKYGDKTQGNSLTETKIQKQLSRNASFDDEDQQELYNQSSCSKSPNQKNNVDSQIDKLN